MGHLSGRPFLIRGYRGGDRTGHHKDGRKQRKNVRVTARTTNSAQLYRRGVAEHLAKLQERERERLAKGALGTSLYELAL